MEIIIIFRYNITVFFFKKTLQTVSRNVTQSSDILLSLLKSLFICLFTFRTFWNFLETFKKFEFEIELNWS